MNTEKKETKKLNPRLFSIKYKLALLFAVTLVTTVFGLLFSALYYSKRAVLEKVQDQLVSKADDTATIIDGRIDAIFRILEGMARQSFLRDPEIPYFEKARMLQEESSFYKIFREANIVETSGMVYFVDGRSYSYDQEQWFIENMKGKRYMTEPFYDVSIGNLFIIGLSVPIYDDEKNIIGVLHGDIKGDFLSKQILDIAVGETGHAFILDQRGVNIGNTNMELVDSQFSVFDAAKDNPALIPAADF